MIERYEYHPYAELQTLDSGKQPIPVLQPIDGWQNIQIDESGEPLVNLHKYTGKRLTVLPQYFIKGYREASFEQEIRAGVFERLLLAAEALPAEYRLVIWDAWRPKSLQSEIYNRFYQQLMQAHAALSPEELAVLCGQFVALPSADPTQPAHHLTGGAVDVTIMDDFGQELWMGTEFDDFSQVAHTRYFESEENCLTDRDKEAQRNRRILHDAMCNVGMFTGLDTEWWHFQYGTQAHGLLTNQKAWYGIPSSKQDGRVA
ncbi:MAG: M15 family metallopeptidase [Candidatus Pacebacteria bacterium]|nr:M15 family metallopeptidase [Candidatus Paceibacterota bacterium]PIR60784.1 MAG: D-alanyl-D-alanine dipeptidase [Candidatus Pacebacteria bacterium CG10_big_fil_rev_8_21_14_0_10_44_54]